MQLTAKNVHSILLGCLFADGITPTNYKEVTGVKLHLGFDPVKLDLHKAEIESMLNGLPDQFKKNSGGGWSFLNACTTKEGTQWADCHETVDELLCLGLGIDKVTILLPRELWPELPGGLPYFVVN